MAKKKKAKTKKKAKVKSCCKNVPGNKVFYLNGGGVLNNLCELRDALKGMNSVVFRHHVNPDRNDFANWVKDVMKKKAVASQLAKAKSKKQALVVVRKACK